MKFFQVGTTMLALTLMVAGSNVYANGVPKHRPPPGAPQLDPPIKADAGGPYPPIKRGASILLDGSKSIGKNLIYEWFFAPEADCRSGPGNTGATKSGMRTRAVLLCSMKVSLKVTDAKGNHAWDSTTVTVTPRPWRIRLRHTSNWNARPGWSPPHAIASSNGPNCLEVGVKFGENWCALPHPQAPGLASRGVEQIGAIHPHGNRFHNTWLEHGYTVEQVDDENGPFHGWHYVSKHELKLEREGVFNQHIKAGTQFYRGNQARGVNMKRMLRGIARHEGMGSGPARSGHSEIFQTVLKTNDPATKIERMWAQSLKELKKKADGEINGINKQLSAQSADPINLSNWMGKYYLYDRAAGKWCRDFLRH